MKLKSLILAIFMAVTCLTANAKGGIPIIYSSGEDVVKVKDLPHIEELEIQGTDGKWYHADLGILHSQFSLFWIPIWNYGEERYVLFTDKKIGNYDFTYADLDSDDIDTLQTLFDGIPDEPSLPFWDKWGGKLVVFFIIGVCIWLGSLNGESDEA